MAWEMLNQIALNDVIYFCFNTRINVCSHKHGFVGTDICPTCGEKAVDSYQRVVGFLTPRKTYSSHRKKEYDARQWYEVAKMYGESSLVND